MIPLLILVCAFGASAEDFPSLITANASLAVVLDRDFLGDRYQKMLEEIKYHIKELARVELKHSGVVVHYFSWSTISLKRGFTAIFSVASCRDTWGLFSRTEEQQLILFALTEADCPRLPAEKAVTVTYMQAGQELPQILLDLRTSKAFDWKSGVILHDDTLSRDMVSRVVQSLTLSVDDGGVSSTSVSVFKMRHEVNEYLRRKEMRRVLSQLPVKHIGENFIAIVTSDVMSSMAETARDLKMSHTQAQWLYIISDTNFRDNNLSVHINALYEGENVAYLYNVTDTDPRCENNMMCYSREMLNAFISALDAAVQDELDVAAQVSDEEWEAIRPTKLQRRDILLRHIQMHLSANSKCGNCSTWRALAADTWGATYTDKHLEKLPHPTAASDDSVNSHGIELKQDRKNFSTEGIIESIELLQVGYWRPIDGLRFTDVLFPHIQHGFRGKELTIATYHNPPWTILQLNESGSIVGHTGLMFDIIDQLAKTKNFTLKLLFTSKTIDDSQNNSSNQVDSANALAAMAAVVQGRAALAAGGFTVLSVPKQGINYTMAVSIQPHAFLLARPRELSRALLFMSPFTSDTWLCLGLAVIVMGPTLYAVHRLSPFYEATGAVSKGGLSTIHNCLWYIYGALLQQGGMYLPKADSGRLVIGTWWLVVLVVVTTYSGNLVAFLTFPVQDTPVTSIAELLESHAHTWSIAKGSYLENQLRESEEPKYKTLLSGAEVTGGAGDGEDRLLQRVRSQRHIVIDWKLRLRYLMREDHLNTDRCDFALSVEEFLDEQVALVLPTGSPYLHIINAELKRMHQTGLINKWLSAYLPRRDRCWRSAHAAQEVTNHTVNIDDMQGSFFVIFLGFFCSSFVLLAEWLWNRRVSRREEVIIKPYTE